MAYGHSFSPDFYGDVYAAVACKRPDNLADAIASMPKRLWNRMARDVFGCKPEFLTVEAVFSKAIETDTVANLSSPVTVYVDADGFYSVDVFEG